MAMGAILDSASRSPASYELCSQCMAATSFLGVVISGMWNRKDYALINVKRHDD